MGRPKASAKIVRVKSTALYNRIHYHAGVRWGDGYETKAHWHVKWDGFISFQAYAKHFIEPMETK